jgi:O-antigen/teichoic acid export membrane protein
LNGQGTQPKTSLSANSAWLVGVNILVALAQLVSIRYIYGWLGEPEYAIYVVVIAFVGYANILSPSASYGILNRLVERLHEGDIEGVARLRRAQTLIVGGVTAAGTAVFVCFGMLYRLPGAHLERPTTLALFSSGAIIFILYQVNQVLEPLLTALEQFRKLAIKSACDGLVGAIVGALLAFRYQSAIGVLLGRATGAAVGLVVNLVNIQRLKHPRGENAGRTGAEQRDLVKFARLGYPHQVFGGAANSADRILYSYSGRPIAELSRYAIAYRVPEMIQSMFISAANAIVPRLAKELALGTDAAGVLLDKSARVMLMIGVCFVWVPSAFGSALLRVWLGHVPPKTPMAMAFLGGYFALQIYMTVMSKAFYASSRLNRAAVFTGANALVTVLLTIPAARWNGIVGVAIMNFAISGVLFVPYAFWTRRYCVPSFAVVPHVRATVQIVIIGGFFAISGYLFSAHGPFLDTPTVSILAAIAWSFISATVIVSLRLASIPDGCRRLVSRVFPVT